MDQIGPSRRELHGGLNDLGCECVELDREVILNVFSRSSEGAKRLALEYELWRAPWTTTRKNHSLRRWWIRSTTLSKTSRRRHPMPCNMQWNRTRNPNPSK